MLTREELEKELEERKRIETLARYYVIKNDDYVAKTNFTKSSLDIIDAEVTVDQKEETVQYPVVEIVEPVEEEPIEKENVEEVKPLNEKEAFVEKIVAQKYAEFIEEEKKSAEESLEQIKKEHANDYDAYLEKLRNSDYYKSCVKKYEKYYAEKRAEFEREARVEAERVEKQAKFDSMPDFERLGEQDGEVAEEVKAEKSHTGARVEREQEFISGSEKADVKMVADPALKKTIEQILLINLQDAIDENRDYYDAEQKAVEASKRINLAFKGAIDVRAELAKALVQSYAKTFDLTENKKVRDPYSKTIRSMQNNIVAKNGNMDIEAVADVVMDTFYHYDLKTKEVSGIISNVAEHLAVQVQEKLISNGQLDFNLCKEAAEVVLEQIADDSAIQMTIALENNKSTIYSEYAGKLAKMYAKVCVELSNGKSISVADKQINELLQNIEELVEDSDISNEILCQNLIVTATELKKIAVDAEYALKTGDETLKAKVLKQIKEERDVLKQFVTPENLIDVKSNKNFEANHLGKKKGVRAIVDKLIIEASKRVGAFNSLGILNEFEITEKTIAEETDKMLDYIDKNRNATLDVTYEILFKMNMIAHDLREKFADDKTKYDRIEKFMMATLQLSEKLTTEEKVLSKNEQKEISSIFNEFIEIAQFTKKGEKRLKVGLEKELEK